MFVVSLNEDTSCLSVIYLLKPYRSTRLFFSDDIIDQGITLLSMLFTKSADNFVCCSCLVSLFLLCFRLELSLSVLAKALGHSASSF